MELFDTEGIDDFINSVNNTKKAYKKEVKKFMRSEGTELRKRTLKTAKSYVEKEKGNYEKSIKRGKYYKYDKTGEDSIRVYSGKPAHHGHLIEYGHEIISPKTRTNKATGRTIKLKNGGKHLGYVNGHLVFGAAADAFESKYEADCEKFNDKVMKELE